MGPEAIQAFLERLVHISTQLQCKISKYLYFASFLRTGANKKFNFTEIVYILKSNLFWSGKFLVFVDKFLTQIFQEL